MSSVAHLIFHIMPMHWSGNMTVISPADKLTINIMQPIKHYRMQSINISCN